MRKRDELTDPGSCMNRARDDEWTFVLLGRDLASPVAVRAWIEERIRLGKNSREDVQIVDAEAWIAAVLAEQEGERLVREEGQGDA
jgi:hypothetical protein